MKLTAQFDIVVADVPETSAASPPPGACHALKQHGTRRGKEPAAHPERDSKSHPASDA